MNFENIEQYIEYVRGEVNSLSNLDDDLDFTENAYTRFVCDNLESADETDSDIFVCHHESRGVKINAYHLNDQENELTLIITYFAGESVKIPKSKIDNHFKRLKTFFSKSVIGTVADVSSEASDLTKLIQNARKSLDTVKLIFITDCYTGSLPGFTEDDNNLTFDYRIWDIERLFRYEISGQSVNPVELYFEEISKNPVVIVKAESLQNSYDTYLGFLSGDTLFNMYDKWGQRLLERNVRAFLQARGKVNQGIRDTIIKNPDMFLAYNNGLTVIAESLELKDLGNGTMQLLKADNFQIVNGGQTCASIWNTKEKNKADLGQIQLVMKLNVIKSEELVEEIAPKISLFSNSQNKVSTADFSANDPFHIDVSKVSQTIFAPDPTGGGKQTKWFYERSRGSYQTERNMQGTPAKIRDWTHIHPRNQLITKTDLAKAEMTYAGRPHDVSMGAQGCFARFTVALRENQGTATEIRADEKYFKQLVAKRILFQQADKVVASQKIPGYKANITTYSIAYYLYKIQYKMDLVEIWNQQNISDDLREVIGEIAHKIREYITEDPNINPTVLCKNRKCWDGIKSKKWKFSDFTTNHFNRVRGEKLENKFEEDIEAEKKKAKKVQDETSKYISASNREDKKKLAAKWFEFSAWGKETNLLSPVQRSIAYNIGRFILLDKKLSIKLQYQVKILVKIAKEHGFNLL